MTVNIEFKLIVVEFEKGNGYTVFMEGINNVIATGESIEDAKENLLTLFKKFLRTQNKEKNDIDEKAASDLMCRLGLVQYGE